MDNNGTSTFGLGGSGGLEEPPPMIDSASRQQSTEVVASAPESANSRGGEGYVKGLYRHPRMRLDAPAAMRLGECHNGNNDSVSKTSGNTSNSYNNNGNNNSNSNSTNNHPNVHPQSNDGSGLNLPASACSSPAPSGYINADSSSRLTLDGTYEVGVFHVSSCPICLEHFTLENPAMLLPTCGHGLHMQCLEGWRQRSPNCPVCLQPLQGQEAHVMGDTDAFRRRRRRRNQRANYAEEKKDQRQRQQEGLFGDLTQKYPEGGDGSGGGACGGMPGWSTDYNGDGSHAEKHSLTPPKGINATSAGGDSKSTAAHGGHFSGDFFAANSDVAAASRFADAPSSGDAYQYFHFAGDNEPSQAFTDADAAIAESRRRGGASERRQRARERDLRLERENAPLFVSDGSLAALFWCC